MFLNMVYWNAVMIYKLQMMHNQKKSLSENTVFKSNVGTIVCLQLVSTSWLKKSKQKNCTLQAFCNVYR